MNQSPISIDWLRFSITYKYLLPVCSYFGLDRDGFMVAGRYGRKLSAPIADGVVLFSDYLPGSQVPENGRFFVDFSGTGLGVYFESQLQLLDFMKSFIEQFEAFTQRLDIAFDDKRGLLNISKIVELVKSGHNVITLWRNYSVVQAGKIGSNLQPTLYLGNRRSDSFMRLYDKRHQMIVKQGYDCNHYFIRLELELKREVADTILNRFIDSGGHSHIFVQYLLSLIEFRTRSGRYRWWREFVGDVSSVPVRLPQPSKTLDSLKRWVNRQVTPTLALLVKEYGHEILEELVISGEERLTPKTLALLTHGN